MLYFLDLELVNYQTNKYAWYEPAEGEKNSLHGKRVRRFQSHKTHNTHTHITESSRERGDKENRLRMKLFEYLLGDLYEIEFLNNVRFIHESN